MAIIGTLPNNIQNGQAVDANPVMADFNFIVNQVNANANPIGTLTAPSGTRTIFHQASAPLGWTQDATLTDHTLEVVASGSGTTGGTNGYSTMFSAQWTTDGHALTTAELASHSHTIPDPGHTHTDSGHQHSMPGSVYYNTTGSSFTAGGVNPIGQVANATAVANAAIVANTTGITGTNVNGSGAAHTHTKTFDALFCRVLMAIKT